NEKRYENFKDKNYKSFKKYKIIVDKTVDSEYNNIVNFMRFIKFDCEKIWRGKWKKQQKKALVSVGLCYLFCWPVLLSPL
ncbi:hypothetical protein, partial [Eubacterium callanderi]|uniref:hypothetical protein n=1 Tax=Eubacterium callanderi TaxID=53442 RepID=UPI0034A2416C